MKLGAEKVPAPDQGRERPAVRSGRHRLHAGPERKTVHIVEMRAVLDPGKERTIGGTPRPVPAHVRYGDVRRSIQQLGATFDDTQTVNAALGGSLQKKLHAQADSEHWLGQRADHLIEARVYQPMHCAGRRTHAGQQHAVRLTDPAGITGQFRFRAEPAQREAQRGDIRAAAVDDGHAHDRTPLVEGTDTPARASGRPSARVTA